MLGLAAGCRFHRWQLIHREAFRLCFGLSLLYNRLLASRRVLTLRPLDDMGKSVKDQLAAKFLSKQLGVNLFGSKPATNECCE
jgi:hypothetical protein